MVGLRFALTVGSCLDAVGFVEHVAVQHRVWVCGGVRVRSCFECGFGLEGRAGEEAIVAFVGGGRVGCGGFFFAVLREGERVLPRVFAR